MGRAAHARRPPGRYPGSIGNAAPAGTAEVDAEVAMTRMLASRPPARPLRRVVACSFALIALLGLAGCSAPTPALDAAAATEQYQPVVDELVSALAEAFPAVVWTQDSETRVTSGDGDGGCSLAI